MTYCTSPIKQRELFTDPPKPRPKPVKRPPKPDADLNWWFTWQPPNDAEWAEHLARGGAK